GGLWPKSSLGFAVRDFFLNGGSQAIVVRLYHTAQDNAAPPVDIPSTAAIVIGALKFKAASEGIWGLALRVAVDTSNIPASIPAALGVPANAVFNLSVTDSGTGASERYLNLTAASSPRRVDNVLKAESALLVYDGAPAGNEAIAPGKDALSVLEDALAAKKQALTDLQNSGAATAAQITAATGAVTADKTALDAAVTAAALKVSDGDYLAILDFLPNNGLTDKKGLFALEQADLFNILCIPPYRNPVNALDMDVNLVSSAAAYCEKRRAMLIVDPPKDWTTKSTAKTKFTDVAQDNVGTGSKNAALYFPRLRQPNPLNDDQVEDFAPCGTVAGVWARTDTQRGVWKAPAGLEAGLVGTAALSVPLTDDENGELNPLGINCLRAFPVYGRIVWGARTLRGADALGDEYKYIPVRRTALYIEESLYRGLKWVVFEPNDEPLWAQIRLNVGAFLHNMFRQGAFQGATPGAAYFVKCDKETTTQNDIDLGIVNVVVGFAPLKPAEFVVLKIQQIAGQIEV
ncbi:MAG: phage tail sheath family protein, partial [Betaproteobacteria bacterium]|nr:phage tail sheath family protein [Betaproteobacteria bacterium]